MMIQEESPCCRDSGHHQIAVNTFRVTRVNQCRDLRYPELQRSGPLFITGKTLLFLLSSPLRTWQFCLAPSCDDVIQTLHGGMHGREVAQDLQTALDSLLPLSLSSASSQVVCPGVGTGISLN